MIFFEDEFSGELHKLPMLEGLLLARQTVPVDERPIHPRRWWLADIGYVSAFTGGCQPTPANWIYRKRGEDTMGFA